MNEETHQFLYSNLWKFKQAMPFQAASICRDATMESPQMNTVSLSVWFLAQPVEPFFVST